MNYTAMMLHPLSDAYSLTDAIARVPAGAWAVGVSGGADSICLLTLLHDRAKRQRDLRLHVVHLNHELRLEDSTTDAAFVQEMAARLGLACTIARRSEIEANLPSLAANPSARYRAARIELFRQVVERDQLDGVILAHHAADQCETVMQRLLRGSGVLGLSGIAADTRLDQLRVLRPLLEAWPGELRQLLLHRAIAWREDASNASPKYQRNRVRKMLTDQPEVCASLRTVGQACAAVRAWVNRTAPRLDERFTIQSLQDWPDLLAGAAARQWLVARGSTPDEVGPDSIARLLEMARDAAAPSRQYFPGPLLVRRRRRVIWAEPQL